MKIILAATVFAASFIWWQEDGATTDIAKSHSLSNSHIGQKVAEMDTLPGIQPVEDYFVDDSIYRWDKRMYQMNVVGTVDDFEKDNSRPKIDPLVKEPIKLKWDNLMGIDYRLRYFSDVEMEMLYPLFSDDIKALEGKEVIIKGYTIPLEADGNLMALSFGSYASCFFCGKASPASIISMYLKEDKFYRVDSYRAFRGTLHINQDDPNQFYYILKDAREAN